jgi:DNA polymerase III subunit epsilon
MNILFFDSESTGLIKFKLPFTNPSQPRLVPKEAEAVHGISTEFATKYGLSLRLVMSLFGELVSIADLVVAHNVDYDKTIAEIESLKLGIPYCLKEKKLFCTMKTSTPICKLPGNYGFKWPKLTEAYQFFFNEKFEGAHDALVDIKATKRVFEYLKTLEGVVV